MVNFVSGAHDASEHMIVQIRVGSFKKEQSKNKSIFDFGVNAFALK